jgi:YVTN family beta-propeller protein
MQNARIILCTTYIAKDLKNTGSLDGSTNTVVATIAVGLYPSGLAFDSSNGDIYVANDGDNSVSVIDGSTNTVVGNISVGVAPAWVAFDSRSGDIYVVNGRYSTISVIDGCSVYKQQ